MAALPPLAAPQPWKLSGRRDDLKAGGLEAATTAWQKAHAEFVCAEQRSDAANSEAMRLGNEKREFEKAERMAWAKVEEIRLRSSSSIRSNQVRPGEVKV